MARTLGLKGRPDRTDFARYVAALPPSNFRLGLTHVTTGYFLRDILDAKKITAMSDCPVLGRPLVYAFYGRPAYRTKHADTPSDLPFLFPAVLILDPDKVPRPRHVFGFDSGAFIAGLMDDYLDPYMPLFDFHLEPNVQSAARLAQTFFRTPRDFLNNNPTTSVSVPAGNFEAVSFSKMVSANGRGANQLDDRVSTPELIFDEIPIEDCVRAAILPDALAADPEIGGRIEGMGVQVKDYEWSGASRPSEYHRTIRKIAYGVFEDLKWL
ncbi:hypothetical protein [Phenylobacterium sp.]|uniref:hypothetical protein n=1 Tax=Phenylobacterium sp. TaxID=1871053 RepID=UPI002C2DD704|nr:hypothetical protein [Phenylobacterium sp.]HLZ77142.1 hypothetical protein [Phenylobacterium sp.]